MTIADDVEGVTREDISLTEAMLGYSIRVHGEHVGGIEGVPGYLEYIVVEPPWEGKGVARAALQEFVALSQDHGETEVTTTNAMVPEMAYILETEGFEEQSEGNGWVKQL